MTPQHVNFISLSDTIWVILQVDTGGILSVTQQMSRFGSDFTENRDRPMMDNPFATPTKLSSSLPNSSAFPMQVRCDHHVQLINNVCVV